ncbi:MAG: WD40/YVTN/BNR-like repeat-containing protein [Crocinitomicaceae bacterium]
MIKLYSIILILLFANSCAPPQYIEAYNGHSSEGFHSRGLAINDSILYVSGAKGRVTVFNINSKVVIDSFSVPANDLRGIKYLNDNSLLLMNSGDDGIVYKYSFDKKVADAKLFVPGAFFDAISINQFGHGFVMGDPMKGRFTLYRTLDYGNSWEALDSNDLPMPLKNEAGFAASNSGISQNNETIGFVTGASDTSRFIRSMNGGSDWIAINTPMKSGKSFGIYSSSFWNEAEGVIAGGSYVEKEYSDSVVFITADGGKTWANISLGLPGYISCIQSIYNGKLLVATGRLGAYYSINKGKKWLKLTKQPFYTALIQGDQIILSGQNGTLSVFHIK